MKKCRTSFPCSWSRGVTIITIITTFVLIISACFIWTDDFPLFMLWLKYTLLVVFMATAVGGFGYMPIRLTVENGRITLSRLFGAIVLSLDDIIECKAIPESDIEGSVRVFGSGGFFGFLGKFRNKRLGFYTMYATNLNELILIRTARKTYVFSCVCRDELINSVNVKKG